MNSGECPENWNETGLTTVALMAVLRERGRRGRGARRHPATPTPITGVLSPQWSQPQPLPPQRAGSVDLTGDAKGLVCSHQRVPALARCESPGHFPSPAPFPDGDFARRMAGEVPVKWPRPQHLRTSAFSHSAPLEKFRKMSTRRASF